MTKSLTTSKLYRIANTFNLPDYVKTAVYEDLATAYESEYPIWIYADTARRKYPCKTKELTILSLADYLLDRDQYSLQRQIEIENNFKKFGSLFHIEQDIENIIKQASFRPEPKIDYALEIFDPIAGLVRALPIRNETEARFAAQYLRNHWFDFTYPVRKTAAQNILKIAADNNYELGPYRNLLERMSGDGIFSLSGFNNAVQIYGHLAKYVASMYKDETLTKTAAQVYDLARNVEYFTKDDLDKCLELLSYPASILKRAETEPPELMTFPISKSEAAEALEDVIKLPSGTVYNATDLVGKLTKEDLLRVLPEDVVSNIKSEVITVPSLKKLLNQMSSEDAKKLEEVLRDKGIKPAAEMSKEIAIPGAETETKD